MLCQTKITGFGKYRYFDWFWKSQLLKHFTITEVVIGYALIFTSGHDPYWGIIA